MIFKAERIPMLHMIQNNISMPFLSSLMMTTNNVGWRNLRFTTTGRLWLASSASWSHSQLSIDLWQRHIIKRASDCGRRPIHRRNDGGTWRVERQFPNARIEAAGPTHRVNDFGGRRCRRSCGTFAGEHCRLRASHRAEVPNRNGHRH